MTSFSATVQAASLLSLASLLLYTFWLMRSGRLSAHVTVRWMLAEAAAILAVVLWSWLPFFSFTVGLDDRELLVILAVVLFVLISFLMLDALARISTHTHQIKRLTQEVALLRPAVERGEPPPAPVLPPESEQASPSHPATMGAREPRPASWPRILAIVWIVGCTAFFVLEMRSDLFRSLKAGLTAGYLE